MNRLLIILLIKAVVLAWIISNSEIGLAPDEAQYWTWSRALDWGYYSKPPGIAWQIWLTSAIFGNTPFGVRFGAVVIGFLLSLAVYATASAARLSQKACFWSAIAAAFSPLGIYLSFAATTDGGAILFLTLAVAVVIKGAQREEGPNYFLAGLCIFCGALFKWTAFIFWPITLSYLLFFKNLRKWSLVGGVIISLLALLPSLYWNVSHEWATFRHVGKTVVGEATKGNFFDFFASQVGLLSPVFFVLLIVSYFFLKQEKNRGLWFSAGFPLVILLYFAVSFFKKMQPNWAAYLYPAGLPLVGWIGYDRLRHGRIWLHIGTWLSIVMVAGMFAMPWLQESTHLPLSYKVNPFRQSVGWNKLPEALFKAGYDPKEDFLFADKYQAANLLSFYGPGQKRAYFFNISATRKNQFSYWPQMDQKEVGKTGYFVVLENMSESAIGWYIDHYQKRLGPYFGTITYRGAYPLYSVAGTPVKYAIIFKGIHYSGKVPQETKKY